ncbi:hypothetical protein ACFLVJ_01385 [Chloroflexota bacterium]
MKTRVQKWGNSLTLRISKSFATEVGLQRESSVEISLENDKKEWWDVDLNPWIDQI